LFISSESGEGGHFKLLDGVVAIELAQFLFGRKLRGFPEVSAGDSFDTRGLSVNETGHVCVVGDTSEELLNDGADLEGKCAFGLGVAFGLAASLLDHIHQLFDGKLLLSAHSELTVTSVFKFVCNSSSQIFVMNRGELSGFVEERCREFTSKSTLGNVGSQVALSGAENEIAGEDSKVLVGSESSGFGLSAEFNPRLGVVLTVGKVVLDGSNGDKGADSVLLGELGGGNQEVVLVGGHCRVVVSEVDNFVSTFKCDVEGLCAGGLVLLDGDAIGLDLSLESVDGLAVGSEVEETDLVVNSLFGEAADDPLADVVSSVHDN